MIDQNSHQRVLYHEYDIAACVQLYNETGGGGGGCALITSRAVLLKGNSLPKEQSHLPDCRLLYHFTSTGPEEQKHNAAIF